MADTSAPLLNSVNENEPTETVVSLNGLPAGSEMVGRTTRGSSVLQNPQLRVTRTLSMQIIAENPSVTGRTGIPGCVFNYTNSIIGAGIIGLPYALSVAGFWYGIILLVFVAFVIGMLFESMCARHPWEGNVQSLVVSQ